jgi:hypothetical protein
MDAAPPPNAPVDSQATVVVTRAAVETPPEPRALELGAGAFVLYGGGAGAYAGVSPFLVREVGDGILLRPSLAFGESLQPGVSSTWGAARFDVCLRMAGLYTAGSGIQLDLCVGEEGGLSYVAGGTAPGAPTKGKTLPYVAAGPSVALRAEIGRVAVTLRALVGLDLVREGYTDVDGDRVDAPALPVRLELGFSWDLANVAGFAQPFSDQASAFTQTRADPSLSPPAL